jgi:hypothetical protein
MLVWRWWICRSSPTSSMGGGGLGARQREDVPGRRATTTYALLRAAGLFIDSQSLVGDGDLLDLAMMEARRFFRRVSRQHWNWTAAAGFGGCEKP